MKLKYAAVWTAVTAAALVTTAGCGTQAAEGTAEAVDGTDAIMAALGRATDRTEQVGSAEVSMTTSMGTGTPVTMDGTYSWGDGFAFDVLMDTAAAQMQAMQDDPKMRMLFVDGAYYYDVDPQASGPLEGKEWMKIDGSAVFGRQGAQALSGSGGGSPSASMKGLKYADNVEDLGSETVNGKTATHYRAVVDQKGMGKYKEAYGNEDNLFGSLTGGATSITMDVWVGAKDLPVRMIQEIGTMKVTMDFEKFGATAGVKAPPAAQTGDLTEAIKEAGAAR
ncbi:hypothetical protein OG613_17710 [Streptomyces sp. NBC_00015]|uniref:hypothetical protein n=1 Tax=unclassified Streptomyces TaxID=2593676 RepID=UPI00224C7E24|nr:hypothetical protein [Streptomyces sp. NBC_00103]MCX5369798.1 hypothetical protein [Streptomyces sp. NBC_00103]